LFIRLFESDIFADCTIKCGDKEWRLHKIILCRESRFFKGAFLGKFVEAETNEVILRDRSPLARPCDTSTVQTPKQAIHLNRSLPW